MRNCSRVHSPKSPRIGAIRILATVMILQQLAPPRPRRGSIFLSAQVGDEQARLRLARVQ